MKRRLRTTNPSPSQRRKVRICQLQHVVRRLAQAQHATIAPTPIEEAAELEQTRDDDPHRVQDRCELAQPTEGDRQAGGGVVHDDAELRVARVGMREVGVLGEDGGDEHDEPDECGYDRVEEIGSASTT